MRMRNLIVGVLAVAVAGLTMSCNSKNLRPGYCKTQSDCASGMTCDIRDGGGTFMCVGDGGMGGTDGKTDGGGGSGGHPFRCDASVQCGDHDAAAPVCEVDAASCVECVKDKDCKKASTPICLSNKCVGCTSSPQCGSQDAGMLICSAGACVECTASSDCTTDAKRPICNTSVGTCVRCTADSQCMAKSTSGPGVCMFQTDGHCATDAETIYVQPTSGSCVSGTSATAGTVGMPFCQLGAAVASAGSRQLFVLRGGSITGGTMISTGGPYSLVGQQTATIIADVGQAGLHVTGTDVYVRDVKIGTLNAATIGIVADGSATIRLDGVEIDNMPQGGLRVTGSAGYDVSNCIFAGNGGMMDEVGRFIGGAYLTMPPSGSPVRFAFNTVVASKDRGVVCTSASQVVDATLLANNLGGGGMPDYSGCTLSSTSKALGTTDPMLTSTYRLTANSPCVDFVTPPPANAPDHDIDGVARPQGGAFDCGASEYKPPQ